MNRRSKVGAASILLVMLVALVACSPKPAGMTHEGYSKAYENAAAFIQANFPANGIDTSIVKAAPLLDREKDVVFVTANGAADYFAENTGQHWVFTIGETLGHQFAKLVCTETGSVIGYIPIE